MKSIRFRWIVLPIFLLVSGVEVTFAQAKPEEQIQMNFHRAENAWRNRTNLLEAKVRADYVLRDEPNHADALKLRAEVLMAMERYAEALKDAERAATLNPDDGSAFLIMAEAARLTGDIPMARHSLEKAAGLAMEESADFHIRLSRSALLLEEQDWGMAESYARVALAKDRNYAAAYYQLARVFAIQGRIEDAVTTLVRGFQAELLDAVYLQNDSTLSSLVGHDRLVEYINE